MPLLRVCHLTPTYFSEDSVIGGGERYVYNLVKAINKANSFTDAKIKQGIISVADNARSFVHEDTPICLLKNINEQPGNMNYIPGEIRSKVINYDLLHIHQGLTQFGAYCTTIAASLDIPFLVTDLGGGKNELMLFGKGLELADRVIAISEYASSLTKSSYSGKTNVIIGPVDTDFFKPSIEKINEKGYGICVSRVLPHKGIDRIINALPQHLELKVVGKVYDASYFRLLKELAKGKRVEFIEDAGDDALLKLYQRAGIFLQGSTHKDVYGNINQKPELMGLTTLEAMACGLPVIISDAGSLPEMVPNNKVGRIFESHSGLVEIFDDYVNKRWPGLNAGEEARNHVLNNYSYLNVGEQLSHIYWEIAKS